MADLGGKLPDGVMMEILSRVPPESLVRFKCVSKSWYALINDPEFGYSLQNRNVLLKRSVTNNATREREIRLSLLKYPLVVDDDDDDDHHTFLHTEDVSIFCDEFPYTSIVGHSHGLVCIAGDAYSIFLYNPVTRELRKLPPSILLIGHEFSDGGLRFGYDSKSRDFKVVRIVMVVPPGTNVYELYDSGLEITYLPSRVEVYDLKKDEWREIETPVPGLVTGSFHSFCDTHHQGFYYWWVRSEVRKDEIVLLSFDMSEEVFSQIPVPQCFHEDNEKVRSMAVLNGSMVLLHYPSASGDEETSFDIWEMVKLGDGVVSWSKIFTIGPVNPIARYQIPLAFVGSDQLLIQTTDFGGQLILYNINTKHSKHLTLEGNSGELEAIVFVKTALSVKGGHNHNLN